MIKRGRMLRDYYNQGEVEISKGTIVEIEHDFGNMVTVRFEYTRKRDRQKFSLCRAAYKTDIEEIPDGKS